MDFRVLGPFEALRSGNPVDLGPNRQRALLAFLLIHANKVVTTDRIIEEFWGDDPDGKESTLWVYISRIRSILEPDREKRAESAVLARHDHGYQLNVPDDRIDAEQFMRLAGEGGRLLKDDPERASAIFQDALELWHGNAYEEFQYESFAQAEAAELEELRTSVFEDRIDADLRSGKAAELVAEIEHHGQQHPMRERPIAQLMLALYRAGRSAEALRAYSRFSRLLGDELGIEPSPDLASLEEQILLHDSRLWVETKHSPAELAVAGEGRNPFKGLQPFRAADAADFFGRERLVAETMRRIKDGASLIALVGASGSGKTSAVSAGVFPSLEAEGVDAPHGWVVAQMVPGARPFAELEAALNRAAPDAVDLKQILTGGPDGLMRGVLRLLDDGRQRVLLFIDQFEELYTLVGDPAETTAFLDALTDACSDVHGRFTAVITLRADFYERVLTHPAFSELLATSQINVSAMSAQDLEAAAMVPARRAGADIEPALLTSLITDVIGEPGALPVFQHTLRELFDRRQADQMTLDAYEASGGVRGMLAARAEDIYGELEPARQHAAQQVFLRLTTITESGERTKRRVEAGELLALELPAEDIEAILASFAEHRLVSFDRDGVTGRPVTEIAHEALLSGWPRLVGWIDAAEDDVKRHARLIAAIDEWEASGRDLDYVFTGRRLDDWRAWAAGSTMLLTGEQLAFLDEGAIREHRLVELEQSRAVRESDLDRRARRRLWWLVAASAVLVMAGALVVVNALSSPPVVAVAHSGRDATDLEISEGIARANAELDVEVIEITPPFERLEDEIATAIELGAELVIVDEFYESLVLPLQEEYPEVVFETVSQTSTGAGFAIEQGAMLIGALAALEADTAVGFVGRAQDRDSERLRAGYEAGAHWARPSIEVFAGYALASAWPDPGLGEAVEAVTAAQLEAGANIVFNAAQDPGVLEAVYALSERGHTSYVVGAFIDEYLVAPADLRSNVLTSLVPRYDGVVVAMIGNYLETGDPNPGVDWTIVDGAMTYARSGVELSPALSRRSERLIDQLSTGVVEAPQVPAGGLMLIPGEYDELKAQVAFDDSACTYTGPLDVPIGTMLDIEFTNNGEVPAVLVAGDSLPVEITASAGGSNRGQVGMFDDVLPIRCQPMDGELGTLRNALDYPRRVPTEAEIDITVTITDSTCDVDVVSHRELVPGDLAGFMIHNTSGAGGGSYSWRAATTVAPDDLPNFDDVGALYRWREAGSADTAFYARPIAEGDWGVGCWRDQGLPQFQTGGVLSVSSPDG